ncbi:MAG: radical SAM protein [archaeon]
MNNNILVTLKCNCDCKYCYQQDKETEYTWNQIKEQLDNFLHHHTRNQYHHINIFGGEPFLALDMIIKIINYIEIENGINDLQYYIITNGTIINDQIIKFLKNNKKVNVGISLDGINEIDNKFRNFKNSNKNIHKIVISNIKKVCNNISNDRITIHTVSNFYNIKNYNQTIEKLYKMGLRKFINVPVRKPVTVNLEFCKQFIKEHNIISKQIAKGNYPNITIDPINFYKKPKKNDKYKININTGQVLNDSYEYKQKYGNCYVIEVLNDNNEIVICDLQYVCLLNHFNNLKKRN